MHTPVLCGAAICKRQNFPFLSVNKNKEPVIDFMQNSSIFTVGVFHGQDVQIVDSYNEYFYTHYLNY